MFLKYSVGHLSSYSAGTKVCWLLFTMTYFYIYIYMYINEYIYMYIYIQCSVGGKVGNMCIYIYICVFNAGHLQTSLFFSWCTEGPFFPRLDPSSIQTKDMCKSSVDIWHARWFRCTTISIGMIFHWSEAVSRSPTPKMNQRFVALKLDDHRHTVQNGWLWKAFKSND